MKALLLAILLTLWIGFFALQTATPQRAPAPQNADRCKCSIEVTVTNSAGKPIAEARVTVRGTTILGVDPPAPEPTVLTESTDAAGRAVFSNLPEDSFGILAEHNGSMDSTTASVGPAPEKHAVQHVTIRMIEKSAISGRIQDANHRPAVGVQVQAFQVVYQLGRRTLRQTGMQVQTDDLGVYRLFWFPPGDYYIRAMTPPTQQVRATVGPTYPSPSYFPGTLDREGAKPIVLEEGQDYSGADFGLQTTNGVTISGTVREAVPGGRVGPTGQPSPARFTFFLAPRNSHLDESPLMLPNVIPANTGRGFGPNNATESPFEIRGVPPGSYDLYAIHIGAAGDRGRGSQNRSAVARIAIEVGTENIGGIKAIVQPGVDLKGHLSVTGNPETLRLEFGPAETVPPSVTFGLPPQTAVDANGTFTVTNLAEGRYSVPFVSGLPADAYVADIRQGSRSIYADGVITIGKEAPEPLEIVIDRGGGTIQWTLVDAQRQPLNTGWVSLVPDPPRRKNQLMYKSQTVPGMTGTFTMTGIAPGTYKLFAWDHNPQGADRNEEFLAQFDGLGTRVNVIAGISVTNIQVQVIPGRR